MYCLFLQVKWKTVKQIKIKKMKKVYLLLFVGLILVASSCSKEDVDVFSSDDAGVYFQYRSSYIYGTGTEFYNDSITYSFASASPTAKAASLSAEIKTLGKVVDYDRPVKIVVDPAGTTAVEGVHYEANLDTFKIAAGESSVRVSIRFLRHEDLLRNSVRLALKLEENEHFKLLIEEYKNTNSYNTTGKMLSGTNFSFTISEKYTRPTYWLFFGSPYFGPWTAKKFVYVNEILGFTVREWTNAGMAGQKIVGGRFSFFGKTLQKDLQERADAGEPLLDEDGSFMQLGPNNLVDYSSYE